MRATVLAIAALIALPLARAEERERGAPQPLLPTYRQECSACHLAYPPGMLPAASWQRLLSGLPRHFGTDASLDPATLKAALKHLDYSEYGGAPLLGVRGVSVISHGKSNPRAIKNAIKLAAKTVETRMIEHIGRRLGETNGNAGAPA